MLFAMCIWLLRLANAFCDLHAAHPSQNVWMSAGRLLCQSCTQHLAFNSAGDVLPCCLSMLYLMHVRLISTHCSESLQRAMLTSLVCHRFSFRCIVTIYTTCSALMAIARCMFNMQYMCFQRDCPAASQQQGQHVLIVQLG